MKISRKYSGLLFGVLMGAFMALIMSFFMMLINVGLNPNFPFIWVRAFGVGAGIGIPTAILISKYVRRIADNLTSQAD